MEATKQEAAIAAIHAIEDSIGMYSSQEWLSPKEIREGSTLYGGRGRVVNQVIMVMVGWSIYSANTKASELASKLRLLGTFGKTAENLYALLVATAGEKPIVMAA